jgi:hypothetical protein
VWTSFHLAFSTCKLRFPWPIHIFYYQLSREFWCLFYVWSVFSFILCFLFTSLISILFPCAFSGFYCLQAFIPFLFPQRFLRVFLLWTAEHSVGSDRLSAYVLPLLFLSFEPFFSIGLRCFYFFFVATTSDVPLLFIVILRLVVLLWFFISFSF